MEERERHNRAALGFALCVALVHALRFRHYFSDDAFISLRYAQRFASGLGLTWTDGERVEGYTNLLWVLIGALGVHADADPVLWMRLWGLAGACAAVVAVSLDPATRRPDARRALIGGLALAVSGGLLAWAMGGLEHAFLAGLVGVFLLTAARACEQDEPALLPALILVAVVWTRADGMVLWVGACIGVALCGGRRQLWPVLLLPALALLAQHGARLAYYGELVPNTARAKVALTPARVQRGLEYVAGGVATHSALLVLAFAGALGASRARVVLPSALGLVWVAYVGFVGGDHFFAQRLLVPALPAAAILTAELRVPAKIGQRCALALCLAAHTALQLLAPPFVRATEPSWTLEVAELGEALRTAWGPRDPLLAVEAAGAMPYHTRFDALDLLGLTDAWLARHPPADFGGRAVGHDLGDGAYAWSREPDIVLFRGGYGSRLPRYTGGLELLRHPGWPQRYQMVFLDATSDGRAAALWVRMDGGPLGVQRRKRTMRIPAWFLGSTRAAAAVPHPGGFAIRGDGVMPYLLLEAGTWQVVRPVGQVQLGCGELLAPTLTLPKSWGVRVEVSTPATVTEVVLRRVPEVATAPRCEP